MSRASSPTSATGGNDSLVSRTVAREERPYPRVNTATRAPWAVAAFAKKMVTGVLPAPPTTTLPTEMTLAPSMW